jgi:hypothetical protein
MPVLPTGVESTPPTFTPAFPFVAQTNDFDDVFACAAMLAGKKIEEVREIAITKTRHPAHGPYYLGETQIAALLAQLGFVATAYKEISRISDIPDLIALDERGVTFRWNDYRAKGRTRNKAMTLAACEFMRRFLLHVLLGGFHRIRHYALLANPVRRAKRQWLRPSLRYARRQAEGVAGPIDISVKHDNQLESGALYLQ